MPKQSIDQWLTEERERLTRFKAFWVQGQKEYGRQDFPSNLDPGEWDEQYRVFADDLEEGVSDVSPDQ